MGCNNCEKAVNVPYAVYEIETAKNERLVHRLCAIIIILIFLLVCSNCMWLWYNSQFETIEQSEEYKVEQNAENGSNNSIIGGGVINGEPKNNL